MYGGRYGLTRYSLNREGGTLEAGEDFSGALSGLAGTTVPVDGGEPFTAALGAAALGAAALDAACAPRAALSAQGRLWAAQAAGAAFDAALSGSVWAGKDLPGAMAPASALGGTVWAGKNTPAGADMEDGLLWAARGAKNLPGELLASGALAALAQAGTQRLEQAVFHLTIPPGGELRVDSGLFTVTLDGENVLHTQEGDWITVSRDLLRLDIECASGGGLEGLLIYTERYL